MASNSEKVLLKQITDLTRQIEMQKKGISSKEYPAKKLAKPWVKKSTNTFVNSYPKGSWHWHKPSIPGYSAGQLGTLAIHPKPASKTIQSFHSVHNKTPIHENINTKVKQVFVNPNFVPGSSGTSVHVNPSFRFRTPAPHTAESAVSTVLVETPSAGSVVSVLPSKVSVATGPSGSATQPTVPLAVDPSGSIAGHSILTVTGPSWSAAEPTAPEATDPSGLTADRSVPKSAGSSGPAARPTVALVVGPCGSDSGPGPSGPTVATVAAGGGGRTRRRSRSLSSRYRVLTARKLVRRLSKDAKTPPAAAPARCPAVHTPAATRRPAVHTRHKLVRVVCTPRSQHLAKKLVSTRHKLIRVASTPRAQHQANRLVTHKPAGAPWSSARTAPGAARPGATSRYKLVRTAAGGAAAAAAAGAAGPARSQHRTWRRRRSSTSTPGARLTSVGSLRLGSARFVNIGGLLYKSTARKLQRAVPRPAQNDKHAAKATVAAAAQTSPRYISVRGARYRVEAGGRSLRRLDQGPPAPPRLDIGGLTFRRAADGTLTADRRQQVNRTLLTRAKSRSLAVLRDSLRLSRQPCRFFCRLGRCQRHERHQCPHVHDPALRPVCTRHLQGGCQRVGCTYNHAPRPEKVPHCLHFLTAECRRDSCPYMHVNVDTDAPLCARFLAGFCAQGQQCTNKHLYICPEFSEDGTCPRGAACPLAHRVRRRRRRRRSVRTKPAAAPPVAPPRGTGRYYLSAEAGQRADAPSDDRHDDGDVERPAMAEMPSFIAIDDQSSGDEE